MIASTSPHSAHFRLKNTIIVFLDFVSAAVMPLLQCKHTVTQLCDSPLLQMASQWVSNSKNENKRYSYTHSTIINSVAIHLWNSWMMHVTKILCAVRYICHLHINIKYISKYAAKIANCFNLDVGFYRYQYLNI